MNYLLTSRVDILMPAEKFFRQAMEELVDPSLRTPLQYSTVNNLKTHSDNKLPPAFVGYDQLKEKLLSNNLCDFAYLNNGTLYRNINCSLILDGVMDKNYAETYILYLSLVRNYSGVGISKLG